MEKPQVLIADATVEAQVLAEKADKKETKVVNLWVSVTCVWHYFWYYLLYYIVECSVCRLLSWIGRFRDQWLN